MRKLVSIPLIILALFSGIWVSIATHYCGGNVAGKRISFSGELAGCGMEAPSNPGTEGLYFSHNCCENIKSAFSYSANYFPTIQCISDPGMSLLQAFFIPVNNVSEDVLFKYTEAVIRPPGCINPSEVSLEDICILRI